MYTEKQIKAGCELNAQGDSWINIIYNLGLGKTKEEAERFRFHCRKSPHYKGKQQRVKPQSNIDDLVQYIKKERTQEEICRKYDLTNRVLKAHIDDLKDQGYEILEIGDKIKLNTQFALNDDTEHEEEWNGNERIKFAIISDTHLGNKHQQLTHLNDFYDQCQVRGIKIVYHVGDLTDGYYKTRPDHVYELHKIGHDERKEYIINNYPKREGIITKFITGNHDDTHIKNGGSNIGKAIDRERDDMQYLGSNYARVFITPNCTLDLFHPGDGAAYALSYSSQKYIDGLQGGSKPNILAIGHHHKGLYMSYRNIHVLEAGSFEAQTSFMRGKKIYGIVGGWFIELEVEKDGTIREFSPTFREYYKMVERDY